MPVDFTSLETIAATLPDVPPRIRGFLLLESAGAEAGKLAAALARRGFIGCWPVGADKDRFVVFRLLPERDIEASPVVSVGKGEANTIAPRAPLAVAGRLAEMFPLLTSVPVGRGQSEDLRAMAKDFGDRAAVARVLAKIPLARRKGRAALWAAIDPRSAWAKIMEAAWSLRRLELRPWLGQAIRKWPGEPIVQRLFVAHHVFYKTGVDVSSAARALVEGDAVFDAGYTGIVAGVTPGWIEDNALIDAVRWLRKHDGGKGIPPLLWDAAVEYAAKRKRYDGARHLRFAKSVADEDPILAFTHAANAAFFFARSKRRAPLAAIRVAKGLAAGNGWDHLSEYFELVKRGGLK